MAVSNGCQQLLSAMVVSNAVSNGCQQRLLAMVVSNGCQQWLSAMAVSNGCQQWLSAMAVSNGCQRWLSAMVVSNGCQQWLSAIVVGNGCQQWLSAIAVSNGCQQWLSQPVSNGCSCCCFVFPPKRVCFEGFGQNGRHHDNEREKSIQMVKISAQTELISRISGFVEGRYQLSRWGTPGLGVRQFPAPMGPTGQGPHS